MFEIRTLSPTSYNVLSLHILNLFLVLDQYVSSLVQQKYDVIYWFTNKRNKHVHDWWHIILCYFEYIF